MLRLWNKIIRKIAYILTHKISEQDEVIRSSISRNGSSYIVSDEFYEINDNNLNYRLRKKGSDINVYKQVILGKEYQSVIDFLIINQKSPSFIIDCGANIGLTSMLFGNNFKDAIIYSIEPDSSNFGMLNYNTQFNQNIVRINKAIWSEITTLKIDRDFRDGQDWSVRTIKESSTSYDTVKTTTIMELLKASNKATIDLLKIDIEGAETELFKSKNSYEFLNYTNCIALEIHDECVDRQTIYNILKKKSFNLFNSGELTIGIKN